MALNLNSGGMNTGINTGLHVRQFDHTLYQRMAENQKATFVSFLRLLGMKRAARNQGDKHGFLSGSKAKNIKNYKYEWQDIWTGTPLSIISGVEVPEGGSLATATTIIVPHGDTDTDAKMFNKNDIILDRNTDERMLVTAVDRPNGKLTVVRGWGTSSGGSASIRADDVLVLISSAHEEGGYSPEARSYNPTQEWNFCQIFKRSVENTGTNEEVESYGNLNHLNVQRQLEFEQFMIERSRAYFKGLRTETTFNGKPIRTTAGLDYFLRNNVFSMTAFTYNNFIDFCEVANKYGGSEKILVVNDKLMSSIQKEIINNGRIQMEVSPLTKEYGFSFNRLKAHKGAMDLLVDSTMSDLYDEPTGFALETGLIDEMIFRPDVWRENIQTPDYDGRKDEIIGECGFKLISPDRHCKLIVTGS